MHVLAFSWEVLLFNRPGVHTGVFAIPTTDVRPVRLWASMSGYDLFLAAGLVAGVIVWSTGSVTVGRTLVVYICLIMVLAGMILFISDRLAMSRPQGRESAGPSHRARRR